MTMWAKKIPGDGVTVADRIEVSTNYGPISITVTEDTSHLRHFWGQLGALLEESAPDPIADPPAAPADLAEQRTAPLH